MRTNLYAEVCGNCMFCQMRYDKQGYEVFSCRNDAKPENEYGCMTPWDEACEYFESVNS